MDSLQRSHNRSGDEALASSGELLALDLMPLSDHILFIDAEALVLNKPAGLPVDAPRPAKARAKFQQAFEKRIVEKFYVAVIAARICEEEGIIDLPLIKRSSVEAGWRMVADELGLEATTRWRRISIHGDTTLVEFQPLTGRTHQIRVHAREAFGTGILGDRVYGVPRGPMLLHASRLIVPRLDKPAIDVTAPFPAYFAEWRNAA